MPSRFAIACVCHAALTQTDDAGAQAAVDSLWSSGLVHDLRKEERTGVELTRYCTHEGRKGAYQRRSDGIAWFVQAR